MDHLLNCFLHRVAVFIAFSLGHNAKQRSMPAYKKTRYRLPLSPLVQPSRLTPIKYREIGPALSYIPMTNRES